MTNKYFLLEALCHRFSPVIIEEKYGRNIQNSLLNRIFILKVMSLYFEAYTFKAQINNKYTLE